MRALNASGPKAIAAFFKGGWKEVPESERWWEQAFAGPVEKKRATNLELIRGVKEGMENSLSTIHN